MKLRLLAPCLWVMGVLGTPVLAEPHAPWDLQALMDALEKSPAGEVGFTERKDLSLLTEPLILKGKLDFRRPAHLEKHVLTPSEEWYVVDGDRLTIVQPEKQINRTVSLREYPGLQAFVESLRAPLAGDRGTLEHFYRVSLGGSRQNWLLALVPVDAEMGKLVRMVQIRGHGERIAEIRIEESGGDVSTLTIEP